MYGMWSASTSRVGCKAQLRQTLGCCPAVHATLALDRHRFIDEHVDQAGPIAAQ